MKIFLDTNVLLDYLLDRSPFADDAEEVVGVCTENGNLGAFSTLTACNMVYIMSKAIPRKDAEALVLQVAKLIGMTVVETEDIKSNLGAEHPDFEDAVQISAAVRWGADVIITRDKRGFTGSPLKVMTPAEFLNDAPTTAQEGEK